MATTELWVIGSGGDYTTLFGGYRDEAAIARRCRAEGERAARAKAYIRKMARPDLVAQVASSRLPA